MSLREVSRLSTPERTAWAIVQISCPAPRVPPTAVRGKHTTSTQGLPDQYTVTGSCESAYDFSHERNVEIGCGRQR